MPVFSPQCLRLLDLLLQEKQFPVWETYAKVRDPALLDYISLD